MPTKKVITKKGTKGAHARTRRNSEGIMRVWGDDSEATPRPNGNGRTKESAVVVVAPRKRNPAPTSEAALRANELTLRAWERIYANRGKRLTD
jgi:hypothetical protein